jgi:nicotinate-nucleotide pyrophosphorylase (carboxylating)
MQPHFTVPVDKISKSDCETLIRLAITEDAPAGDPTSEDIFPPDLAGSARIVAREDGILCGVPVARFLFEIFLEMTGHSISLVSARTDSEPFVPGDPLISMRGSMVGILRIERILLNFLQYLSGIATVTASAVRHAPPGVFVLDTRKTIPGYRRLVKYAVCTGGGTNHRIHLSEMAMIKDNHIAAAGGIAQAAQRIRQNHPELPCEIEVDRVEQIPDAIAERPRVLLLDNMDAPRIREAVARVLSETKKMGLTPPIIEVSGGWTPAKLGDLRNLELPVGVSMGYLTHTTRFLDLSLEMESP